MMFLEELYPYALHILIEEGWWYVIFAVPALLQNWFFFNVRLLHWEKVDGYDTLFWWEFPKLLLFWNWSLTELFLGNLTPVSSCLVMLT